MSLLAQKCFFLMFTYCISQISILNTQLKDSKCQSESSEQEKKKAEETIELERTKYQQQVLIALNL